MTDPERALLALAKLSFADLQKAIHAMPPAARSPVARMVLQIVMGNFAEFMSAKELVETLDEAHRMCRETLEELKRS